MEISQIQRYKNKSVGELKKIAIRHFNEFIRLRDSENGVGKCISSGRLVNATSGDWQAGHFIPAPTENLRFNEDNVNGQSLADNYYKSGNVAEYRKNLIKKIGLERVEKIEMLSAWYKQHGHIWDRFSLIEIIQTYKNKVKKLKEQ